MTFAIPTTSIGEQHNRATHIGKGAQKRRRVLKPQGVDLGSGATVSGVQIEIDTGYSCHMTAARHVVAGGHFFSPRDVAPGAAVRQVDRDNTGYTSSFAHLRPS